MAVREATLTALRMAYQVWAESRGDDVRALLDLMADDVEVTTLPDGAGPLTFTKACRDKAEMTEYFQALVGDWCNRRQRGGVSGFGGEYQIRQRRDGWSALDVEAMTEVIEE